MFKCSSYDKKCKYNISKKTNNKEKLKIDIRENFMTKYKIFYLNNECEQRKATKL